VAATASRLQHEYGGGGGGGGSFHPMRPLALSYGLTHHRRPDPLAPILMKDRPPSAALLQVTFYFSCSLLATFSSCLIDI